MDAMHYSDVEIQILLNDNNFPPLQNKRILQAAKGEVPDRLPIWIMRQAGRYLPEFREFRKKYDFLEICESPRLACEVTLMPIRKFDLDAAIIFSDILVIPQALGMHVDMDPERGPIFTSPLTISTLNELQWEGAIDRLRYVGQAIKLTRHALEGKVPLITFSAAPWTLMVHMIDGGSTKTASKAKRWIYSHHKQAQELIDHLSEVVIDYFVMQVEYGAQMLQLFESCAEFLDYDIYKQFVLPSLLTIRCSVFNKLKIKGIEQVPIVFFAKGGGHLINLQVEAGFDVIGLDWLTDPCNVRMMNENVTLQGNLDPCVLYADKDAMTKCVTNMLGEFGFYRYIVNLGHGIYPDTNPEAVKWLIDTVHSYKPEGH